MIAGFAVGYVMLLPDLLERMPVHPGCGSRWFVLLSPLAFAMGMLFLLALRALGERSPALVPWAWGINGCTSVVAAAAPLLGSSFGFSGLIVAAAAGYLVLTLVGLSAPGADYVAAF